MKLLYATLAVALLALPPVAAAQDVKVDFDKSYSFRPDATYSIKLGTRWGNDLSERRILAEFDEAIAAKGWKKVPDAQAAIHVILHGATETKHNASTFYTGMGGGYGPYGYGGWGGGMATANTVVSEYQVGTLVVDMFDAKSKNLVFRGQAQDEISDNPEKNAKRVEKASAKMFKNFPPGIDKK
jgi:hypothetical protein